jgi:LPXTG-motif cell wall-anchored protein
MVKRWIVPVLAVVLATMVSVTGAMAAPSKGGEGSVDAAWSEGAKKLRERGAGGAGALTSLANQEQAPGKEEPPGEDCLDQSTPEGVEKFLALVREFHAGNEAVVENDPVIGRLDADLEAALKAYERALRAARSAAEINEAFDDVNAAIETWQTGVKARMPDLLPEFERVAEQLVEAFIDAGFCEEVVEAVRLSVQDSEPTMRGFQALADSLAAEFRAAAAAAREQALKDLEQGPRPRPDQPLSPPPSPGGGEPTLPDTGAVALPLLLGGLTLLSGGTTALLIGRRRRVAE